MQGNKKLNEVRIHPTQKPVALYEWLLTKYAKPGWKILDTHVGSGSSLIACRRLDFEAVGFVILFFHVNAKFLWLETWAYIFGRCDNGGCKN